MKRALPFSLHDAPRRRSRLSSYNGKDWGFELEPGAVAEGPIMNPARLIPRQRRMTGFSLFVIAAGLLLLGRLAHLQIVQGKALFASAEQNRTRLVPVAAPRGLLFDRNGMQLVRNVPTVDLEVTPVDFPNRTIPREAVAALAPILGVSEDELVAEVSALVETLKKSNYDAATLRERLTDEQSMRIRLIENTLPGFHVAEHARRDYTSPLSLSAALGYVGKINQDELSALAEDGYVQTDVLGKQGVEQSYEAVLRGTYGKQEVEVNALGKTQRVLATQAPIPGNDLTLTLDANLQQLAEESLARMIDSTGATGGAAVVIDVRTGALRTLVSAPTFDNNLFVKGISQDDYEALSSDPHRPLFFRAIAGQYPPGSTIKPLIASVALQEGIITPATSVLSNGGIHVGQWFFPDWKAGGHGRTDVRKAIAESVNTFFYSVGGGFGDFRGLGIARLAALLRSFGLGAVTNIDLSGEQDGFLPTPAWKEEAKGESWYIGDTYHASIGQGDLLVTPLQMAVATAAIANGGTLFRPFLVDHETAPDGTVRTHDPAVTNKDFVSPANLQVVREGMRQAVTAGSSTAMQSAVVTTAGKTGTAQFGNQGKQHAWFTAFAPYEDPEIAIAVVLEGGGEGHAAALPVARDIVNAYFQEKH